MNDDELERELRERERRGESDKQGELEAYFRELVASYVNFPDLLKLELKPSRRGWALLIEPDVSDYAIVAGKRGRNFNALKTLVDAIGERRDMEIEILLEGPLVTDTKRIRKQLPYKVNPQWAPALVKALMMQTLRLAGMEHVQVRMQKNTVVDAANPFDDQTTYWFFGMRTDAEALFVQALGQLMESVGTAQGQRLMPRFNKEAAQVEKAG
jgi:predicted RNA-binding protein YlqC (UPF0109 family)